MCSWIIRGSNDGLRMKEDGTAAAQWRDSRSVIDFIQFDLRVTEVDYMCSVILYLKLRSWVHFEISGIVTATGERSIFFVSVEIMS